MASQLTPQQAVAAVLDRFASAHLDSMSTTDISFTAGEHDSKGYLAQKRSLLLPGDFSRRSDEEQQLHETDGNLVRAINLLRARNPRQPRNAPDERPKIVSKMESEEELVFPSLSFRSPTASQIFVTTLAGVPITDVPVLPELLNRELSTPLKPLLNLNGTDPSGMTNLKKSYLSQALRSLLSHLAHSRIQTWILMLSRVIAFQGCDVESMHKRVLVALEEVQESIEVENELKANFRVSAMSEEEASASEVAEVEHELAQLAAEAITSMKAQATGELQPSFSKDRKRSRTVTPSAGAPCDGFLIPIDTSIRCVPFKVVLEVSANVSVQIGPDIDQKQVVYFQTSGTVVGTFKRTNETFDEQPSAQSMSGWKLCGAKLNLNTEELVTNMEKQARYVARSAAESALLSVAAEVELQSDERSICTESVDVQSVEDDLHCSNEDIQSPSVLSTPSRDRGISSRIDLTPGLVSPTPVRAGLNGFFLNTRSPSSQPPFSSPPSSSSPLLAPVLVSPLEGNNMDGMSPPPLKKKLKFGSRDRHGLFSLSKKRMVVSSNGPCIPELDNSSNHGALADIAGALASLKHSASQLCA